MEKVSTRRKNRGRSASSRAVKTFLLVALFYASVPPLLTLVRPAFRGEVYPLSMWSMFYKVHNEVDDFGLRILSLNGKPKASPVYFEHSGLRHAHSIVAYHAIQKLGRQLNSKKPAPAARRQVEQAWLKKRAVYEVVQRRWDPYERYRDKTFLEEKVLARFEVGGLP